MVARKPTDSCIVFTTTLGENKVRGHPVKIKIVLHSLAEIGYFFVRKMINFGVQTRGMWPNIFSKSIIKTICILVKRFNQTLLKPEFYAQNIKLLMDS